jgi:homoaconitase/3-isopropylmalate dehydratase large subunit
LVTCSSSSSRSELNGLQGSHQAPAYWSPAAAAAAAVMYLDGMSA